MKYKNAAIVCAAAGCLFILLAVVCGGAVRWCAMAAAPSTSTSSKTCAL